MEIFLIILHVLVCFFLIFIVLLQTGKGAQIGASFGGSSQTLFGARGTTTFLGKMTTGAAIIFMFTSLLLTVFSTKQPSMVPDTTPVEETAPAKPMEEAPAQQKEGVVEPTQQQIPTGQQGTGSPPPPAESGQVPEQQKEGVVEPTQQQIPTGQQGTGSPPPPAESGQVPEQQKEGVVEPTQQQAPPHIEDDKEAAPSQPTRQSPDSGKQN
jgi:preprotein translocase subunit SecG